jgi:hypothetical protein
MGRQVPAGNTLLYRLISLNSRLSMPRNHRGGADPAAFPPLPFIAEVTASAGYPLSK